MEKTKQVTALELLNKNSVWVKSKNEKYKVVYNSEQWVILKRIKNGTEEAWRLVDKAPNHFLDNFEPVE